MRKTLTANQNQSCQAFTVTDHTTLSAPPPSDQGLNLLCPVRALRIYIEPSAPFRQLEQLFVCFGSHTKGFPVTKQRLSRWVVDAITLAYSSLGQQCPMGVKAHSTRGIASSWTWSSGVSIAEICAVVGWASLSTFVRFYNLEVPALQDRGPFCITGSLQYWRLPSCTLLALNRAPRLYRFRMNTQGWVDLYEFDPMTFCRASLYNTWSLWRHDSVFALVEVT